MVLSSSAIVVIVVATIQVAFATRDYYRPCEPPHRPDYGRYGPVRDSYSTGSTITFYCDSGYRLNGSSYSVCRYGRWAYQPPVCRRIRMTTCPVRGDPPYGSIRANGNTPGSTIHYRCNKGFRLVGDVWQRCLRTGNWSGKEPICKSIRIGDVLYPDFDDPPYGSDNKPDNTPGSTAHYECDEGFELVGDAYRKCQDKGSGDIPIDVMCPDLDDPRYGSVSVTDNTPGSIAIYACDIGFKLVGENIRECLSNGDWSGQAPVCRRNATRCPRLPPPRYGKINVTGYTPTSNAYYSCDKGYELIGSEYRLCRYDGSWYGDAPVCQPKKIVCSKLDAPRYGRVDVKGYTPSSVAYYSCNRGYRRRGLRYRKCQRDGSWYGTAPSCEQIKYYHKG